MFSEIMSPESCRIPREEGRHTKPKILHVLTTLNLALRKELKFFFFFNNEIVLVCLF